MMHRILRYHARSVYEDGSVLSKDYPFLQEHAKAAGVTLETDGIPLDAAQRLVDGWNRYAAKAKPRRYYYSLPLVPRSGS
jgi:hypothetical protein